MVEMKVDGKGNMRRVLEGRGSGEAPVSRKEGLPI